MAVKNKKQNLRQLDAAESTEINGGTTNSASINMSSSTDSLLSIEFNWQQGDSSKSYKVEAGKDVDVNLNVYGNGTQ
ncbi:hypothetical protein ACFQZS_17145 [Mucilaginibacter calamicampi]|uniref:Natural product n=1 Tax=Mucilaginibacter calamicampi TaxID=1302352 RepID=A0ABW2YZI1_9SPHI